MQQGPGSNSIVVGDRYSRVKMSERNATLTQTCVKLDTDMLTVNSDERHDRSFNGNRDLWILFSFHFGHDHATFYNFWCERTLHLQSLSAASKH